MPKPLTVWPTTNSGKFLKWWEYQTTWPDSWEICKQARKQQLELDMEQQTDPKSGKKYVKAVYCHPAYLTYMQSTSWETLGWMKHKLESRLKAGEEGDDRGWDGWMASPTQWRWVWVNSGSCPWTRRPGCCSPWGHRELDTTERLNWTMRTLRWYCHENRWQPASWEICMQVRKQQLELDIKQQTGSK